MCHSSVHYQFIPYTRHTRTWIFTDYIVYVCTYIDIHACNIYKLWCIMLSVMYTKRTIYMYHKNKKSVLGCACHLKVHLYIMNQVDRFETVITNRIIKLFAFIVRYHEKCWFLKLMLMKQPPPPFHSHTQHLILQIKYNIDNKKSMISNG